METPQTTQEKIERKIRSALEPVHLEVVNESDKHAVPRGSESHFKVVIVTSRFIGQPLIERHRNVNRLLAQELAENLHALALRTLTPEEWQADNAHIAPTPACLGGSKKG